MPQAKRLISAALMDNQSKIRKAIQKVNYYMKRNYIAYKSHAKKKMEALEPSLGTT